MLAAAVTMMMTTVAALPHARVGHGPAVVLVHGMNTDRRLWDALVPSLGRTHTVIAVDLPGHGAAAAEKVRDVDELARRIAATVRAEKVGPAVIVGHSMGGTITGHVPLVAPDVTRAIVIVDSSIGPPPWTQKDIDGLFAALKQDHDGTLRKFFAPICRPAQLDELLAMAHPPDETRRAYFEAMLRQPVADGGRAIGVPVLLMASKLLLPRQKPRAAELAEAGYAHVRDLTVVDFDQSLHYLMWDEPDKLADTLAKFLARVERR